jgi:hypothetical protein
MKRKDGDALYLTELSCRAQFKGIICPGCQLPASDHGIHNSTWQRTDVCPYTWIGAIRRAFDALKPEDGEK